MTRVELPQGYKLEEVGQNLLLRRPNGYTLAALGEGVKSENILRVAIADQEYLRAVERAERHGLAADGGHRSRCGGVEARRLSYF